MREILFRGKRVDNGEWVEGRLLADDVIVPKGQEFTTVGNYIDECNLIAYTVIPDTTGQYTGLTDKNGKKIFEGDCWLDTDGDYLVCVVEFRDGQFGFVCYGWQGALMPYGFDEDAGGFGEIDFTPMTDFNIDSLEITHNIHDNPELLESEVQGE